MTDCPVCGRGFEEKEELNSHKEQDHPAFTETYATEGAQDWWESQSDVAQEQILLASGVDPRHKGLSWLNLGQENQALIKEEYYEAREAFAKEQADPEGEHEKWKEAGDKPISDYRFDLEIEDKDKEAEEIDQQEDKPVQTHDDWQKELEGLKDEFATEQEKCAICNGEHPTNEHPVTETDETEDSYKDMLAKKDTLSGLGDYKLEEHPDEGLGYQKGQEEGGADDPLSKVADLAESYRFMSRDKRLTLFESLDFTQRDSAILSGLEWNELTRPIKVEASEAFAKEEDEEEETGEDPEKEENDAYENFYNLEKYHDSPDYKKKAIECNRCNEKFYNLRDKDVHFNEVHATEQEYELPDQCPLCNQLIQEPETLDWHMEQSHGAHVPSTFTQAGVAGAMADTDLDSLESHKKAREVYKTLEVGGISQTFDTYEEMMEAYKNFPEGTWQYTQVNESYAREAKWECLDCDSDFDDAGQHQEETGHHNIIKKTEEAKEGYTVQVKDESGHVTWQQSYDSREEAEKARSWHEQDHGYPVSILDSDYLGESYAKEDYIPAPYDQHFEWVASMDQDDYVCKHCGQQMMWDSPMGRNALHTAPEHEIIPIVEQHLASHGITESYAKESKSSSELKEEIRKQKEFINMASFENPLNMGDAEDKLHDLESELESLGGEELELTEGEGGHQDLEDTTVYPEDDYEWIDGKRVKKKSTEEEDEGWGPNWGDPEDTAKDIYDLGHPEKTEEGDY